MIHWTDDYPSFSQPMHHGRIMHAPLKGTATAETTAAGRSASSALEATTVPFWSPQNPGEWWQVEFDEPQLADCVAIAGEFAGQTVSVYRDDGDGFALLIEGAIVRNGAAMYLFRPQEVTRIRLVFSGVPALCVVYAGTALALPVPSYVGHQADYMHRETTFSSNVSAGGHFLGRSIKRTGLVVSCELSHIPEDVYRAQMDPFADSARARPFFYAPKPLGYQEDIVYCRVDQDIAPQRMGVGGNMVSVSFGGTGFVI